MLPCFTLTRFLLVISLKLSGWSDPNHTLEFTEKSEAGGFQIGEKKIMEIDLSQACGSFQVIGAAPELLFTHNLSATFAFLLFFSKKSMLPVFSPEIHDIFQTVFNTTFCICHRNGDTEPEKLRFHLVYVTGERKLCTMWQRRLREEARRNLLLQSALGLLPLLPSSPGSFSLLPTHRCVYSSLPCESWRFRTAPDETLNPRRLPAQKQNSVVLFLPFAETLIPRRSLSGS